MSNALDETTMETLSAITKAQTSGILESTGAWSYDLTGLVNLIPVVTPFRDILAREQSQNGSPFAIWRAFMNITNSQPSPFIGMDFAASEVNFQEQDFQAKYQPIGLAGLVTQDAFDLAKGLFDPYANATFQTLNQVLIGEDKALVGGQSYNLPRPAAPTLTTSATGGTLAAGAFFAAVAPRTGEGYYYGGNGRGNSNTTTLAAGTTWTVTASIAAVKGAVAYDWFYSANGSTWYYASTTTTSSYTFTAPLAANAAVPALPDLSSAVPTYNAAADNGSGDAKAFDGFLASLTGDYTAAGQFTTAGTANANGATWVDNGGAALTLSGGSVTALENMFLSIWNVAKTSPTAVMVNAAQAQEIANLILATPSAVTYLNTDDSGRVNVTAGGRVGHVVNAPANTVVPIEVHTALPPGTIAFRTDRVPWPQSNISNVLAVRTLRDMTQFDYATARIANTLGGGPRKEFEIRSMEAFINRAPAAMGLLTNVA